MIRLDRYSPPWVKGILEDLDAGVPPAEAVGNAVHALRDLVSEAARQAAVLEAKATALDAATYIYAPDFARDNRRQEANERRLYENRLRGEMEIASGLKGEVIGVAGILR